MIRLVNGLNYQNYASDLDQMFRLRKRVFHDRLDCEVNVSSEYEIDSYDAGLWDTNDEMLQQLRDASGIQHSVLENDFQIERAAA